MDHKKSLVDIASEETNILGFLGPIEYKYDEEFIVTIESYPISNLPNNLAQWAFDLVKRNVGEFYKKSNYGWIPREKRDEMREPGARYLIARRKNDHTSEQEQQQDHEQKLRRDGGELLGFLLFQFSWEELRSPNHRTCKRKRTWDLSHANDGRSGQTMENEENYQIDGISPSLFLDPKEAGEYDYEILSKDL
ncbi:8686_t:CDS:2 [Ambispora gerdemannii]|uniref:8686_t:CDS:1 n=1 Tax=Ambispora gerdemannii TaxID=144530 RepID=A0A9N9F0B1_9GLOM|nr:8686_t:CDS:2 [Ambispora gerdemannii]